MKKLKGMKTYLGLIAAGVLGIVVTGGWATFDDQWVKVVAVLITTWTGVAINHAARKQGN